MGRIAGAARAEPRLTAWYLALAAVPRGGGGAVATLQPAAVVTALPRLTPRQLADAADGGGPSVLRRQLLADLAVRALGGQRSSVRLTGPGVRRIAAAFASVAHRDGWVAAALAPWPVGVDVESVAEAAAARDVVLAGVDPSLDLAGWHGVAGVWAAKEASLKALGRDLTTAPDHWTFGDRHVALDGIGLTIDLVAAGGMVAALAYAGA